MIKKWIFLIIAIFIICVPLVAIIIIDYYHDFGLIKALLYTKEREEKIIAEAIKTGNYHLCEKLPESIPDILPKSSCYAQVGGALRDATICARGNPIDQCYDGLAKRYDDMTYCDKNQKDAPIRSRFGLDCYVYFAKKNKNPKICDNIQNNDYKNHCYVMSGLVEELICKEQRILSYKDACYLKLAKKIEDASFCLKIVNNYDKEYCNSLLKK